jgi:hypothetical protein
MDVIYGNGEMLFGGQSIGFIIYYKGNIKIIEKEDNLFILAGKNKIVGMSLNGENLPQTLFRYKGKIKVSYCDIVFSDNSVRQVVAKNIYLNHYNKISTKWDFVASHWDYKSVPKRIPNQKNIVVNNNLKVEYDGQYIYSDRTPVSEGEDIHVYGNGVVMLGANEDYEQKERIYDYSLTGRKFKTKYILGKE